MKTSDSSSESPVSSSSSASSTRSNTDSQSQILKSTADASKYHNDNSVSFDSNVAKLGNSDQSKSAETTEEIVTVKFTTQKGEIFTKAFSRNDHISEIKRQLANLFNLSDEQVQVEKSEKILDDDVMLVSLGVEPLGIVELDVKTSSPFILNRDLIYGYIPAMMDVITVRDVHGVELVVEIERQRGEKEWLGGYRHRLTKKAYHHASTQTEKDEPEKLKISRCLQVNECKDSSTSTPLTKGVQTSWIPSEGDRIISSRERQPQKISEEPTAQDTPTGDDNVDDADYTIDSSKASIERKQPKSYLQGIYDEIIKWNHKETKKLEALNEPERRIRRVEISDHTRKFLLRVENEKRKLGKMRCREMRKQMLSEATTPKTFTSRTGERVCMETVTSQRALHLKTLYDNYNDAVPPQVRIKAIIQLRNFFSRIRDYEFADDIIQLLQCELNLLTKGLAVTSGMKERIEQFIFYFVRQCMFSARAMNAHLPCMVDQTPYRNILTNLQNFEMSKFKCFTSVCFRMRVSEMQYLVSEIWQDMSIQSECKDLQQLRMTRWLSTEEWSPCNCILLTKFEIKNHLKMDVAEYDKCFQSKVRNNHLRAKLHFCDILPDVGTK